MKRNKLTTWIVIGLVLGVAVGYACNTLVPDAKAAKEIASYFSALADIFLRLVKMIIAPLVFATLVAGITSIGDSKAVGRIGLKAMGWFVTASFISLLLGIIWSNFLHLGTSMHLPLPEAGAATNLKTASLNVREFMVNVFPKSIFDAMGTNSVLQIVVFSLFFGFALSSLKHKTGRAIITSVDELVHVMIKITDYVMLFAPVGVFAAVAAAITVQGISVLGTYASFVGSFYLGLASLWIVLITNGYLSFLGWLKSLP